MKPLHLETLIAGICIMACHCSRLPMAGTTSGSETTNGRISGTIKSAGACRSNILVRLLPASFDPVKGGGPIIAAFDTTDSFGNFTFDRVDSGSYVMEAVNRVDLTRASIAGVLVDQDTVRLPLCTLAVPGSIKVMPPENADAVNGYVFIPGTHISKRIDRTTAMAVLDSVPAGIIPSVNYSSTHDLAATVIRFAVSVKSGDTTAIFNPSWKYRAQLQFNTTSTGAAVTGDVVNFPVLIRLNDAAFDFDQARRDGADLRFSKSDTTPLSYEIARWDAVHHQAEIWVRVDTVHGNDSTHAITMYWGNPNATTVSNSAVVFDTTIGFQGVWHLAEDGNTVAKDATINGYNGTPFGMTAASSVPGVFGMAQKFDGNSSYIQMTGTAGGKLNFNENGFYTISAWVYADTLDYDSTSARHDMTIAAKDNCQYLLKCFGTDFGFAQYIGSTGWKASLSPAVAAAWKYVVGVCAGNRQYLYVDGICMSDIVNYIGTSSRARYTASDVTIGKTPPGSIGWSPYFFKGKIEEVRMSNNALSADWIKLCYMNQRVDDKLVVVK